MKDHRNIIDQYFKSAKEEPVDISINDIRNLVQGLNPAMSVNSSVLTQSIFKLKYILMLSTSAIIIVGALSFFTLKSEPIEVKELTPKKIENSIKPYQPVKFKNLMLLEDESADNLNGEEKSQLLVDEIQLNKSNVVIAKEVKELDVNVEKESIQNSNHTDYRIDEPADSDELVLYLEEQDLQKSECLSKGLIHDYQMLRDTSDRKISSISYDRVDYFGEIREYWALVKNDGKFGFIDTSGKEVVPTIYKRIDHFGLLKKQWALVKNGGKFGFIDFYGKEVVPLKYDRIDFYGLNKENWAQVKNDGLFGFIDENGLEIVAPKYDRINFFGQLHDNWALVKYKGKFGFIDSIGKEVVPLEYDRINHFGLYKQGWALVKNSGKYGFIDSDGNEIVAPIYDKVSFFGLVKEGWMKVNRNGKEFFIGADGKEIQNQSYAKEQ